MRTHQTFTTGVNSPADDTGGFETWAWMRDNGPNALDPNPPPGVAGLRALGATVTQAVVDAQNAYNDAAEQIQEDTADGFAVGDGSGVIESDQAALSQAAAALTAAQSAAGMVSTPAQQITNATSVIPASTQAALQAVNPNVFSGSTVAQIISQIQAAAANANLTAVQKQALNNQLATLQGGIFSQANMPMLLIGLAAIFMMSKK
jgi:hypothetical protein